jgi:hypothetical protein
MRLFDALLLGFNSDYNQNVIVVLNIVLVLTTSVAYTLNCRPLELWAMPPLQLLSFQIE